MAFTFDAGIGGRKRDEDEERPQGAVRDETRVYNDNGRKVGDLPTVTPRNDDEDQPMVYDGGKKPEEESPVRYDTGAESEPVVQAPVAQPVVTPEPEAKEEKPKAPKKAEEEKPFVYVPPTTNAGGTSGAGTNAAGTKGALTGIPEGSENWTPEQWKEYMNQPGNREAMADVTRSTADAARAERNRERAERSGIDRAERNAPPAPKQPGNTAAPAANVQPAYAWQGIRPGDFDALNDLMGFGAPKTGGTPAPTPAPTPQREPDSVRYAREAAERRNSPPAPQPAAPRRSGEERADRNAPTGTFQPKVGTQQWYEENGLSWAGQPNRGGTPVTMPDVTADYPGSGGYEAMLEDGIRIRMSRGESREDAERHTREDIARQNVAAAVEQAGGGTPGVIRYEPTAKTAAEQAQEAETQDILTATTAAGEKSAVQIAQENGVDPNVLTDPGFLKAFKGYKDQGYNNNSAFMTALAGYDAKVQDETRVLKNEYVNEAIEKSGQDPRDITPEQYEQIEREAEARAEKDYTEQTGKRYQEPRRAGEERAEQGMSYNPPTTGGSPAAREDSSPRTSGEPSPNPTRPGANAEVNSWSWEPSSVTEARRKGEEEARRAAGNQGKNTGAGGTTGAGTGTGTGSGTGGTESGTGTGSGSGSSGNGKNKDVPDGSKYYPPSYNQEGKVVKAPYRKGGYTEEEIIKMGNDVAKDKYGKPLKDRYGNPFYEGYYEWNGRYYPVDQIKANYFRENGSYAGWNEGMRDYWNTFGTFYGYRPGWRVDGRLGGGGGGGYSGGGRSGGGYSYGGGSSSSGGSRSGGATANNGLYFNPNTSWNI